MLENLVLTAPLPYMELDNFPKFSDLPMELRQAIWQLAVPVQDRMVDCPALRKIKHASCPILFLVCKEAKLCAETQYHRLQPYKRDYDIVMSDLVPGTTGKGLPISLDHDIFVVQQSKWRGWYANKCDPVREAEASFNNKKELSEICKWIEKFSANGVRRGCVTCPKCKIGRGPFEDDTDPWNGHFCTSCSEFCEMIYFSNIRAMWNENKFQKEWSWRWSHRL
jgi:hypothetical protein